MAERLLQLTVDTQQATLNLEALARALDHTAKNASAFSKSVATGLAGADRNLAKVGAAADKFAAATKSLSGVKLDPNTPSRVLAFAKAMDAIANTKTISRAKVDNLNTFIRSVSKLQAPTGVQRVVAVLDSLSKAKIPTTSQTARLKAFFATLNGMGSGMPTGQARGITQLASALATISNVNPPSQAKIARIKLLFDTLASLRAIPNADKIANDITKVGRAAQTASNGFAGLPPRILQTGNAANKSRAGILHLSNDLRGLSARFSFAYQSGTLFGTLFSTLTIGTFVRQVYDTNVQLLRLANTMFFATGTFAGAKKAMGEFAGMSVRLGLDMKAAADPFSRFIISAKTSGLEYAKAVKVFESVSGVLTVVGASTQQMELAFYGLTQMIMKGKVTSEEFNRQIGEQIPGNAIIGARALSKLEGKAVSVTEFFKRMRDGAILSKDFLIAYGEALKEEFGPLLEQALKRPDVALRRLGTAFTLFKQAIGEAGFMQAITLSLDALTKKIIYLDKDGVPHLTESAQKLAKEIGTNLANLVQATGRVMGYLAENIDKVVIAAKALIALQLGKATLGLFGSLAGSGVGLLGKSTKFLAPAAAATATQGATGAAGGGRGLFGILPPIKFPKLPTMGPLFSDPAGQMVASGAAKTAASGAAKGGLLRGIMSLPFQATAKGFGLLTGALRLLLPVAAGVAGLFAALGLAMVVFSDKAVQVQGKTVKVGDILSGTLKTLGSRMKDVFNGGTGPLSKFSKLFEYFGKNAGDILVNVSASFVWLSEVIVRAFVGIGKALYDLVISPLVSAVETVDALRKKDFRAAGKAAIGMIPGVNAIKAGKDVVDMVGDIFKNVSFGAIKAQIEKGTLASASARAGDQASRDQYDAAQHQLEAALAAREAARKQSEAADDLKSAANDFKGNAVYTWAEVRKDLQSLVDGSYYSSVAGGAKDAAATSAAVTAAATGVGTITRSTNGFDVPAPPPPPPGTSMESSAPAAGTTYPTNIMSSKYAYANGLYLPNGMLDIGDLYRTIQRQESGGRAGAVGQMTSSGQAIGAMQMIAGTARAQAERDGQQLDMKLFTGKTAEALAYQQQLGLNYIKHLSDKYKGDFEKVALAYYGGETNGPDDPGKQWGPLTHVYARDIMTSLGLTFSGKYQGDPNNKDMEARTMAALASTPIRKDAIAFSKKIGELPYVGNTTEDIAGKAPMSDSEVETESEKRLKRYNKLTDVMRTITPGDSAYGEMQDLLRALHEYAEGEKDLAAKAAGANKGYTANITQAQLDRIGLGVDKAQRNMEDALNPEGKANRLMSEQLEVQKLINAGYQDEAEWLQRMQQYQEDFNVDAAKAAATEKEKYLTLKNQERVMKAQQTILELQESLDVRRQGAAASQAYDYRRQALMDVTGKQGGTMAQLEAGVPPDLMAAAERLAELRRQWDHPPGFQKWVEGLDTVANRLEDIKAKFMDSLSDAITGALVGDKVDWKGIMKGLQRDLTKVMVDQMLAGMLGKFGVNVPKTPAEVAANTSVVAANTSSEAATVQTQAASTQIEAANMQMQAATAMTQAVQAAGSVGGGGVGAGSGVSLSTALTNAFGGGASPLEAMSSSVEPADIIKNVPDLVTSYMYDSNSPMPFLNNDVSPIDIVASRSPSAIMPANIMSNVPDLMTMSQKLGDMSGFQAAGSGGSRMGSFLGNMAMMALPLAIGGIMHLFKKKKKKADIPQTVHGVIGDMREISTTGTQVAGHANPIATVLNTALSLAMSTFGIPGMGGPGIQGFGGFLEGGYSTSPVSFVNMPSWRFAGAPHYAEGTHNTSGIPAVLHPNEAVIPLSRGRAVPVELNGEHGNGGVVVHSTMIVNTPDADSFRRSRGAIERKQSGALRRAAARNLTN